MSGRQNRTFICSVLFVDMAGYSREPVATQIGLRNRLNALLSDALKGVAPDDRVVLDTGDGAAVTFLGDPEDALFMALTLRDSAATGAAPAESALKMRLGINLGPVKLVKDINGRPNVIGDGINVAQRIMSFATPGQVLVSRSYYEVVARLSEEYSRLFRHEGSRTDKHVREHEVYAVEADAAAPRGTSHGSARQLPSGGGFRALVQGGLARTLRASGNTLRRRPALASQVAVALILAGAVALRSGREAPVAAAVEANPAAAVNSALSRAPGPPPPAAVQMPVEAAPSTARVAEHAPSNEKTERATGVKKRVATRIAKPATVSFAVSPWGEIYVDGEMRGVSPPLRNLTLKPGAHQIEVKNTTFPSHVETIDVAAGAKATVRYRFAQLK